MKPSEILTQAADQIESVGWAWREWFAAYDGPNLEPEWTDCKVCAGGGINVAAGYPPDIEEHDDGTPAALAFKALARRLNSFLDNNEQVCEFVETVTSWNDARDQTAEEVVAELRAAAATEREAGR